MSVDPDEGLRALAEHLDPGLGRRLLALLSAEHGAVAIIEAQHEAQHQADVAAEIRRQMMSLEQQVDGLQHGSWFVLTEEPYHDNSILLGVGRSLQHARSLLRAHRIAMRLHNDVPYDVWREGSVSNAAEQRTVWHAEHGGATYQIVEWRQSP